MGKGEPKTRKNQDLFGKGLELILGENISLYRTSVEQSLDCTFCAV